MNNKPFLCRLGLHSADKYKCVKFTKSRGRHIWHTNYAICKRCGKRLARIAVKKLKKVSE